MITIKGNLADGAACQCMAKGRSSQLQQAAEQEQPATKTVCTVMAMADHDG